jgi:hypothetical protein
MRCPTCNAENDKETGRCSGCGTILARKPKRRATEVEAPSPFAWPVEPANWPCTRAYWVACAGLIPGLGLVLGPAAIVLGLLGRAYARSQPECTAVEQATAAVLFGSLSALTNWLGLALMVLGWRGDAP